MDSIIKSITEKFESRAKFGKEKYGVDMDRKDLKFGQWVTHMKEELMDAIIYLEKLEKMSEGGGDEKNKGFLTFEEARDQAESCYKYQEGVYQYKIEGKGRTLVEDGRVLVEGADDVHWCEKGVYSYEIKGEGYTLIEHGKVLIEGVDCVGWYVKGVYRYEIKGKGCTLVEDGKVVIEGVDWVHCHEKGVYVYAIQGKGWTLIEDGRVLVEGADDVHWYSKGVYWYEMKGKGRTLVEDGKVLVDGADCVYLYDKGVYRYKMKGGDWVNMKGKRKKPCKLCEAIRKALKLKPSAAKINNKENVEVY